MLNSTLRRFVRRCVREPGPTSTFVIATAVGIGLASVLTAVIWGTLGRDLPVEGGERIYQVALSDDSPRIDTLPVEIFEALETPGDTYEAVLAWLPFGVAVSGFDDYAERVSGAQVSAAFFARFGVKPLLGRVFSAQEEAAGAPVVVIGEDLWRRRLGADPGAVGRKLRLYGQEKTLIGVMPASFLFPYKQELWYPLDRQTARNSPWMQGLLVARPGAHPAQIAAELESRRTATKTLSKHLLELVPYQVAYVPAEVRRGLRLAWVAMACMLLLLCFNMTQIQLARGLSRRREQALHSALGAGWRRLMGHELGDTLLLTGLGGLLGWVLAHGLLKIYQGTVQPWGPFWIDMRLDGTVFLATFGLVLVCGLIAGFWPAWSAATRSASEALKTRHGGSPKMVRGFRILVILQVAGASTLCAASFALLHSVDTLRRESPLLDRQDTVLIDLSSYPLRRDPDWTEPMDRLWTAIEAALTDLPGVEAVTYGESPSREPGKSDAIFIDDRLQQVTDADLQWIGPGFFDLLESPIQAGSDWQNASTDALVSRRLAHDLGAALGLAPDELIGRSVAHASRTTVDDSGSENPRWFRIVGIAPDLAGAERDPGRLYLPAPMPGFGSGSHLLIRARPGALDDPRTVPQALAHVHPELISGPARPLDEAAWGRRRSLLSSRLIFAGFGGSALIFTALGLYGLWELDLRRRRREIGLRQALGALPRDIVRLMLRPGVVLVMIGCLLGAPGGWLLLKMLAGVYSLPLTELLPTTGFAALLVALVGLTVGLIPAYRAARVRPEAVLRED